MTEAVSLSPIFALPAEADRDALVVSLHDVAPETKTATEKILADLARHHIATCSLLVVPNYHHHGLFSDDSAFVRWLRDLESSGHEIVIHGYFHRRPRRASETANEKLLTRFYTRDEGEFYDLDFDEAFRRISRAKGEFASAGLTPRGFIAPAWLLSQAAEQAAAQAEMEYTTRLASVSDLQSGDNFHARTLVYSVRNGWRRMASLIWNRALAQQLQSAPLARVSLHPCDRQYPEIWEQILRLTARLAENRTATTYQDWIANRRTRTLV